MKRYSILILLVLLLASCRKGTPVGNADFERCFSAAIQSAMTDPGKMDMLITTFSNLITALMSASPSDVNTDQRMDKAFVALDYALRLGDVIRLAEQSRVDRSGQALKLLERRVRSTMACYPQAAKSGEEQEYLVLFLAHAVRGRLTNVNEIVAEKMVGLDEVDRLPLLVVNRVLAAGARKYDVSDIGMSNAQELAVLFSRVSGSH